MGLKSILDLSTCAFLVSLLNSVVRKEYIYIYVVQVNQKNSKEDFPGGTVVKNPPANAGDTGSSPALGRSHMPQSN